MSRSTPETEIPAWVARLSTVLLAAMLLYAIVGFPEFDRELVAKTDYVNPWNRIIWLGLLALALPVGFARRDAVLALTKGAWPLLVLYAFFIASTSWALDEAASIRRIMFASVQLLLSIVLLSGIRRAQTLHFLIAAVCALAAVEDVIGWVLWPSFAMLDEGFAGLQSQKNYTGLLMMYGCMAAATAWFTVRQRRYRLMLGAALALMAGLLVLTRSTTSQSIALLAPFVIPAMLVLSRQPKPVIWAVVAAIPTMLLALLLGYIAWCGIVDTDPWRVVRQMTFTGRTDLWSFSLQEIAKRPWLGAGYSSFWGIDPAVQPSLKSDMWFGTDVIINEAHNGYLELLLTGGVVGLVLGVGVVLRTLAIAGRAIVRAEPAAVAAQTGRMALPTAVFHFTLLVSLLVHNFTESNLFSNTSVLAVAFVLAALDLEKWRLAVRTAPAPAYPNPRPYVPLRTAGVEGPRIVEAARGGMIALTK